MVGRSRDQRGLDVHRLRHQQRLACAKSRLQALQHAVVKDALVGGVLIDQHQTLRSLGHQVAGADLPDRPQRSTRIAARNRFLQRQRRGAVHHQLRFADPRRGNTCY